MNSNLNEPRGQSTQEVEPTVHPYRKKCVIKDCKEKATTWWPLLPGGPAFCNKHYKRATEYGADLSRILKNIIEREIN